MFNTSAISPQLLEMISRIPNPHVREYRMQHLFHPYKTKFLEGKKDVLIYIVSKLAGGDIKQSYSRRNKVDKLWLSLILKDYRHQRKLGTTWWNNIPFWNGSRLVEIDKGIAPAIFALNKRGIKTSYCCEGRVNEDDQMHSITPYI